MIKAVIFDCFGVLTTDLWREFCDSLPKGKVVDRARRLNHLYDAGQISLDEFLQEVQDATGRDKKIVKRIFENSDSVKNLPLIDYIRTLKTSYKIGMISNVATNWVRESFLTADEQQLFDMMVFSYEVGTTKPDPRIYQAGLDKLSIAANECIFIDDQPRYVDGARAIGMQAIIYQNFEQMKTELDAILAN